MKSYTVFWNKNREEEPVFVKESFSYGCFFFAFFYMLFNKMWDRSIILFMTHTMLYCFLKADFIDFTRLCFLHFSVMFFCGASFSYWKNDYFFSKKEYDDYVVYSEDLVGAKLRFCQMVGYEGCKV